jgi:hypothetical protein
LHVKVSPTESLPGVGVRYDTISPPSRSTANPGQYREPFVPVLSGDSWP